LALVDLHAHVLAGVDDGPAETPAALALLQALVDDGVETVYATPHVLPHRYDVTPELRDERLRALRAAADGAGIAIAIEPGGEVDLELAASFDDATLRAFALGGEAVLVEFPWGGSWPYGLGPTCRRLRERGFLPVVAHPERARVVQGAPERLDEIIASGGVCQLTAASVSGAFGEGPQRTAFELLETRRAHVVASDAHGADRRAPDFSGARRALVARYGPDYAEVLLDASRDVVKGRVPQLPRPQRRRRPQLPRPRLPRIPRPRWPRRGEDDGDAQTAE
jgi:protein-tyrosine phosphatase